MASRLKKCVCDVRQKNSNNSTGNIITMIIFCTSNIKRINALNITWLTLNVNSGLNFVCSKHSHVGLRLRESFNGKEAFQNRRFQKHSLKDKSKRYNEKRKV